MIHMIWIILNGIPGLLYELNNDLVYEKSDNKSKFYVGRILLSWL